MAEVTIIGFPQSTYVRTVRMACEEKGVSYELEGRDFGSEELKAIHPTLRVSWLKRIGPAETADRRAQIVNRVDVTVTTGAGSGTLAGGYTYVMPTK